MIGGVTRHMLPHLSGVTHLYENRPLVIIKPPAIILELFMVQKFSNIFSHKRNEKYTCRSSELFPIYDTTE